MLWLVYRFPRGLLRLLFAYRLNVVALDADEYVFVDVDARLSCQGPNGTTGGRSMFTNDSEAGSTRWPLVRVQAGGETEIVVCGSRFLPLTTHWVGQTTVCAGDGCALCDVLPVRGLFYLPVVCGSRPSILELSSTSASHFEQHCKLLHGGIRPGLVVRLSRRGRKQPVYSEVVSCIETASTVPLLDFVGKVMILFHFPGPNPGEDFPSYETRLRAMVLLRADRERRRYESRSSAGLSGR